MNDKAKQILIFGSSGHAASVYELCLNLKLEVVGFVDDNLQKPKYFEGLPVRGLEAYDSALKIVVAVGNPIIRRNICNRFSENRLSDPLIHQSSIVSPHAKIGRGSVVMAGAIININSFIGKNVILNTGCIVEHGCTIEDYSHICPGAALAGDVVVREQSWVGINATVIQGITIEKSSYVAAGCAVVRNVPQGTLVAGVPGSLKKDFKWPS